MLNNFDFDFSYFQDSLKHYREHARSGDIETTKRRLTGCPYDDCVASHFLTTDSILDSNVVISDVKIQNEFLEGLSKFELQIRKVKLSYQHYYE